MQLRVGDRLTDATGEWEVGGRGSWPASPNRATWTPLPPCFYNPLSANFTISRVPDSEPCLNCVYILSSFWWH